LASRHAALLEAIQNGRKRIEEQLICCAERAEFVNLIFNNPNSLVNDFRHIMATHPHLQFAPELVKEFRALLDQKTAELQNLETEIAAFSESTKIQKTD
jgi:F0F1-type ATP synthase delta subunit